VVPHCQHAPRTITHLSEHFFDDIASADDQRDFGIAAYDYLQLFLKQEAPPAGIFSGKRGRLIGVQRFDGESRQRLICHPGQLECLAKHGQAALRSVQRRNDPRQLYGFRWNQQTRHHASTHHRVYRVPGNDPRHLAPSLPHQYHQVRLGLLGETAYFDTRQPGLDDERRRMGSHLRVCPPA